ncbi:hypothetical protein BDW22DRAFT_1446956, partial [Trametopsis cervina]
VVLFHGDLGTGEKIESAIERRCLEDSPWLRLQFVVFVLGLFYLKMACVDALWRVFIQPMEARHDDTCLMKDISILRPQETGVIGSKPGFRRMHRVVQHAGICQRLECWRVEVNKRNENHSTLKKFADSKPTLTQLKEFANYLALNYTGRQTVLRKMRNQPVAARDQQYENTLIFQEYSLLYEEITYAMNHCDIGRVETCFIPWICIFKASRKHKYAKHLIKYLTKVHFEFPPGLNRKAVRYSILINPSGHPDRFRVSQIRIFPIK